MSDHHQKEMYVAMRVKSLMDAAEELDAMAQDRRDYELIQRDEDDLALAYAKLGRLLTKLRFPILRSA